MIIDIYRTNDMESAAHALAKNHSHVLIYEKTNGFCHRTIRMRRSLLKDLNPKVIRSWDSFSKNQVEQWRKDGGVVNWRDGDKVSNVPECDAILMTEMPLFPDDFYRIYNLARKEIVIFVPPDWSMHEEEINRRYPLSDVLVKLRSTIDNLRGYHDDLTKVQRAVLAIGECDPAKTAVFGHAEIEKLAEVPVGVFRSLFLRRRVYTRYECYRPMVPPEDPSLTEIYASLCNVPEIGGGIRALKSGAHMPHIPPKASFLLKKLRLAKSIQKFDDVYLIEKPFKPINYDIFDAEQGVIRKQHYKLREFIQDKPIYAVEPLSPRKKGRKNESDLG